MRWIIFDVMGVIFEVGDDTNDLLVPYIQTKNPRISSKKINDLYLKASLGEISSYNFWGQLGLENQYPEIEKYYLNNCLRVDPNFLEIAQLLSEEFSLAILSNDIKEWSIYLCNKYKLDSLCKIVIISGEVGCRKPDPRIYEILLDRIEALPSKCVLVDDRATNLQTAYKLGLKTIRFVRENLGEEFSPDYEITSFRELPGIVKEVFR